MTTADPSVPEPSAPDAAPKAIDVWVDRVDRFCDRAGDWCNPILVKEARQALKSRQFTWTFGLLLAGAWVWSVGGTMLMSPQINYMPRGGAMLLGYYFVLAVPMLLVAPMAAHRSLVGEREDGTFEVLSITTLSSYQIILGKLASAVLQLVIYFTALVPCVAFTYILRGIDLPSIALLVTSTFLLAIFLVVISLFLATIATGRTIQSVLMILLLLIILLAEYLQALFAFHVIDVGVGSENTELIASLIAALTFYFAFTFFLLFAAASCISPASENKSTRLKVMMLVVQALAIFWLTYLTLYIEDQGVNYRRSMFRDAVAHAGIGPILIVISGFIYWIGMGGLMLGEPQTLSARVRRGLPNSFFGRMFCTWLNPGPGTGMVFAIVSFAAVVGTAVGLEQITTVPTDLKDRTVLYLGLTLLGYMMLFLGLTRLLVAVVRGSGNVTPFVSFVATGLMMSLCCIIPYSSGLYSHNFRQFSWDEYQITNWVWTLFQFAVGYNQWYVPWAILSIGGVAVLVNMYFVGRDVMILRISTPKRVLEELASLNPPAEDESIDPLA